MSQAQIDWIKQIGCCVDDGGGDDDDDDDDRNHI